MEWISQPPDLTDILRGSYLAGRAISRIIAVRPLTGACSLYNITAWKVKEFFAYSAKFFYGFVCFPLPHPVQHDERRPASAGRRKTPRRVHARRRETSSICFWRRHAHRQKHLSACKCTSAASVRSQAAASSSERAQFRRNVSTPRPSKPCVWRACRSRRTHRPGAPAGRGCSGR